MTDKPVLLVKTSDEQYRLLIHKDVLTRGHPPWDEEYFNLCVCDGELTSYWGSEQITYPGYRYQCFYMENDQLAKEFAALVSRTILAFSSPPKPNPELPSGLLEF